MNFTRTPRMTEIEERMAPLEDELDDLRVRRPTCPGPEREAFTSEIRRLRSALGKLGKEYWDISMKVNQEWHTQKPLWQKKFQ
ncbi:hypothetical protein [Thioalkalivibrio thiocyanodenitrificans]|uniref:hypothetical protein n=1 Tax=Thioalkalivibrio thiocyanodenitrificans TaxID=243063 RepID=UPI0003A42323|nr:hypothetical protein [Thioalkalivibrio thiocyanodenitrificans]